MHKPKRTIPSPVHGLRTIWHFVRRGFMNGLRVGAIAGTFILPVVGTALAGFVGALVGLGIGFLIGIITTVYNRIAYQQQADFESYRNNLVIISSTVAISTTTLAVSQLGAAPETQFIMLPYLVLLTPFAGLTAAYVAHQYAEDHSQIIKRKNENTQATVTHHIERMTINRYIDYFVSKAQWLFYSGLIIANIAAIFYATYTSMTTFDVSGIVGWVVSFVTVTAAVSLGWTIYFMIVSAILASANGFFIQMLNRLVFSSELTATEYKRRVMLSTGLFTLLVTPIVGLVIGAPILAVLAALAARDYADWHYSHNAQQLRRDIHQLEASNPTTVQEDDDLLLHVHENELLDKQQA